MAPVMASDRVTAHMRTLRRGADGPYATVEIHDRVDSTNAQARRDPVPWRVVVAEEQTAGRGRLDRGWTTDARVSLAVSVVVPTPEEPTWVPLAAGLAVHRAVADVCDVATVLKWPNDVLVPSDGQRKLAGILCELIPGAVIVGTGVNVNQARDALPLDSATSLRASGAGEVDRERLLAAYLVHLAQLHTACADTAAGREMRAAYAAACSTIGRDVTVERPGGQSVAMRATGLDRWGRLVGQARDGAHVVVPAGDVIHIRPSSSRQE